MKLWHQLCLTLWRMGFFAEYLESGVGFVTDELCASLEDDRFDQIFPERVRRLSSLYWTPVAVASHAAKLLVRKPGIRVLDVGCGPGKFCLIAAALTDGHFTGIEQRADLAKVAKDAALKERRKNIEIIHGNVTDLSFSEYDAFYLFNPFEENVFENQSIDRSVPLSADLYIKYIKYVAAELCAKPFGTLVVTYAGPALEVPSCYDCELSAFGRDLKLWVKVREAMPDDAQFGMIQHCGRRIGTDRFSKLRKSPNFNTRHGERV
jgi:SAM-dependent methyltransferase